LSLQLGESDVFDDMGQTLLILGAPGAGKTTLLLALASDLLSRAENDTDHPIPVVFNLSS
jgi:predicted NACHT family NTPase